MADIKRPKRRNPNQARVQAILSDPRLAARIRLDLGDKYGLEPEQKDIDLAFDLSTEAGQAEFLQWKLSRA